MLAQILSARPTGGLKLTDEELLASAIDPVMLEDGSSLAQVNPVKQTESVTNKKRAEMWSANVSLTWEIIKGLTFRTAATYNTTNNRIDKFYKEGSKEAFRNGQKPYGDTQMGRDLRWTNSNQLTWKQKINKKNSYDIMLGHEISYRSNEYLLGQAMDFPVDYLGNNNLGLGATPSKVVTDFGDKKLLSFFARGNYNYDNRYLLTATVRADGSTVFSKKNKWGFFPSFSGAWRISEEKFFNVKPVSNLKLRASWGQLGNQSIGSWYPTIASVSKENVVFGTAADNQILYAGYTQSKLGNKSLEWETTTVTNIGVDLGFFNNSLSFSADYFVKNTSGILRSMVLPLSVGLGAPNMNYAEVQNRGLDLEISYKGNIRDLHYSVGANVSFLHNEIKKLSSGINEEVIDIGCYGGVTINRIGEPISALYGYKTDGVITTSEEAKKYKDMGQGNAKVGRLKYKDLDGNGVIDGKDRTILGSFIPKATAGMTLSADWKGFDLNMVFSGVFGRKQHSPMSFQNRMPNRNMSRHWYDNRWTLGSDPAGKYPALIQGENYEEMTDLMVANSSFVKMKSLTLGYTFNLKPTRIRVFLSGENLFTIKDKTFDGFDPENGNSVGHYTNWGDDFPTPRILLIGTNLTF